LYFSLGPTFRVAADAVDETRIKNKTRIIDATVIECSFVLVFIYLLLHISFINDSSQKSNDLEIYIKNRFATTSKMST
jgi:hypothetical protein